MSEKRNRGKMDDCFYGTVTMGERGQVVIPADLRRDMDVQPGDKLLILKHPSGKGMVLFPLEAMQEFMDQMLSTLQQVEALESGREVAGRKVEAREVAGQAAAGRDDGKEVPEEDMRE